MLQKQKAFTLLEMLVTLVLLAIVLLIAIPQWQHMLVQNRTDSEVRQLLSALNFARSEAIKETSKVTFCASSNKQYCGGAWQDGQIVIMNDHLLRVYGPLPPGDKLFWKGSLGKEQIEFVATGFTNGQSGSFIFCPRDLKYAKRVIIEQSGRARISDDVIQC